MITIPAPVSPRPTSAAKPNRPHRSDPRHHPEARGARQANNWLPISQPTGTAGIIHGVSPPGQTALRAAADTPHVPPIRLPRNGWCPRPPAPPLGFGRNYNFLQAQCVILSAKIQAIRPVRRHLAHGIHHKTKTEQAQNLYEHDRNGGDSRASDKNRQNHGPRQITPRNSQQSCRRPLRG